MVYIFLRDFFNFDGIDDNFAAVPCVDPTISRAFALQLETAVGPDKGNVLLDMSTPLSSLWNSEVKWLFLDKMKTSNWSRRDELLLLKNIDDDLWLFIINRKF